MMKHAAKHVFVFGLLMLSAPNALHALPDFLSTQPREPWVGTIHVDVKDNGLSDIWTYFCHEGSVTGRAEICLGLDKFPHGAGKYGMCSISLLLSIKDPYVLDPTGHVSISFGNRSVGYLPSETGEPEGTYFDNSFAAPIVRALAETNRSDLTSRLNYASLLHETEMSVVFRLEEHGIQKLVLQMTGLGELVRDSMRNCNATLQIPAEPR